MTMSIKILNELMACTTEIIQEVLKPSIQVKTEAYFDIIKIMIKDSCTKKNHKNSDTE